MTLQLPIPTSDPRVELISPGDDSIFVEACAHPFKFAKTSRRFPAGVNLAQIVHEVQPRKALNRYCHVFINGEPILRQRWHSVCPKPGTTVTIRAVPQGGGGFKNILRTVLMLVVIIAASVLTMGGGAFLGAPLLAIGTTTITVGMALGAAVGIIGMILINTLIPPSSPKIRGLGNGGTNESPTLSITGARNTINLYGPVPRIYGKFRIVPPYGARPFTSIEGHDQFLHLLFDLGPGPLEITQLQIGETALDSFSGVEYEIREGYPSDDPLTLYTNDVFEENFSVLLSQAEGYISRTSQPNTDTISLDITFPQGLFGVNEMGDKTSRTVEIQAQYRPYVPGGYIVNPNAFNLSPWVTNNASVTADATQAVDGTLTADKLIENGANSQHYVNQTYTKSTNSSAFFEWAIDAKAAERSAIELTLSDNNGNNGISASYDLSTPQTSGVNVWGGTWEGIEATITSRGNGWYRCYISGISDPYPNAVFAVKLKSSYAGSTTYTGDGTSGAYISNGDFSGDWQSLTAPVSFGTRVTKNLVRPPIKEVGRGGRESEREFVHQTTTSIVTVDHITGALKAGNPLNTAFRIASVMLSSDTNISPTMTDIRNQTLKDEGWFAPVLTKTPTIFVTVGPGVVDAPEFVVTDNSGVAIRRSLAFQVPTGQYDVRLRRLTPDLPVTGEIQRVFDAVYFTALRSISNEPPIKVKSHCLIAVKIKATDQLNGVVDEFNCVAQSILTDFDGNQWVIRATSNPGAIYYDVLTGVANSGALEDERIDFFSIEEFSNECRINNREFNAVIDFETTVFGMLKMVAGVGRAVPSLIDGLYGVTMDKVKTVPVQYFTPRNSWGFKGQRVYPDQPHALKCPFINRVTNWRQDERYVYADGFDESNATRFETLDMFGVTDPDHVWKDGRYFQAVGQLRPESFIIQADIEHIVCRQGDLVNVTHDVLAVGIGAGRIKTVTLDGGNNTTQITVDESFGMDVGKTYGVVIRNQENTKITAQVNTVPGYNTTLVFTTPLPPSQMPEAGDMIGYGELGREALECVVKSIEPTEELTARITLLPYSPGIFTADSGGIPEYDPLLTVLTTKPPPPIVISVDAGDNALLILKDGTVQSRIAVTVASGAGTVPTMSYEGRFSVSDATGDPTHAVMVPGKADTIFFSPVQDGLTYNLRIRSLSFDNVPSDWVDINNVFVTGKLNPPPVPDTFNVQRLPDGTRRYDWVLTNVPADVRAGGGFQIRWQYGSTTNWSTMNVLPPGFVVGYSLESNELSAGTYTFAIKTIDSSGNESETAKFIDSVVLDDPRLRFVLAFKSEVNEGWLGYKTDCFVDADGTLQAVSNGDWSNLDATWDAMDATWEAVLPQKSLIVYETLQIDMGADVSFSPLITLSAIGTPTLTMRTATEAEGGIAPNLLLRSEELTHATWTKTSSSVSTSSELDPIGDGTTVFLIIENSANTIHSIRQTITKAASSLSYFAGGYFKPNGRNAVNIVLNDVTESNGITAKFDILNQQLIAASTFGSGFAVVSTILDRIGETGWYRVGVIATTNTNTTLHFFVSLVEGSTDSYQGNGTSSIFATKMQLAQINYVPAYVKTTTTAVTGPASATYVAIGPVSGKRYLQIKASITGSTPAANQLDILADAEVLVDAYEDLVTSASSAGVFERVATGHFRLQARSDISAITRATILAFQNSGSGWTWELISKAATSGVLTPPPPIAEFKIYQNGTLTDATIDVEIKGVKG